MRTISNVRIPAAKIPSANIEEDVCKNKLAKELHVKIEDIHTFRIKKRSIDARAKKPVMLVYSFEYELKGELSNARPLPQIEIPHVVRQSVQPIVVGAGCAGLFCALTLARAGACPTVIEMGKDANRRRQDITNFYKNRILNTASNIQFGLGGAGTFSDGKLYSGIKSKYIHFVLETFAEHGAPSNILIDSHPHIGSDILPGVVSSIAQEIRTLGGEILFDTKLENIEIVNRKISSISTICADGTHRNFECNTLFLCTGHSSRDTYRMLQRQGVALESKTFAMGVRIEHLQEDVNKALYRDQAKNEFLGAAPYKAAVHLENGSNVFTFCMCPGGQVVACASEPNAVVTNGASLSTRAGKNANSALLVNVMPANYSNDALYGIIIQEKYEQLAYKLGGSNYSAPVQLVGDFLRSTPSTSLGHIKPTYPLGVKLTSIDECLPAHIAKTLREGIPMLANKLPFMKDEEAPLTAIESRSSSPVRITRDKGMQSLNVGGLYPLGEGAGYAGGIMSSAVDGINGAVRYLISF